MKKLFIPTVSLLAFAYTASAQAATRTVCFDLRFADARVNCPTSGDGVKRACASAGHSSAVGHRVEVWDKDDFSCGSSSSDDEFIGTFILTGAGTQCVTFEWENASYSKGEANPDVYIRHINQVRATTGAGGIVRGTDGGGGAYPLTTWRNGNASSCSAYLATNCTSGGSCQVLPGGFLVPTNDRATNKAQMIMAIDSAQRSLQTYTSILDGTTTNVQFPSTDPNCTTGCAYDRQTLGIPAGLGTDGNLLTHEMGHVLQMQQFNQDDLRDDCSWLGNGWGYATNGFEWQSCAVTEGFATYAGLASWWDPNNTRSVPRYFGIDFEDATLAQPTCSDNAWLPRQATKAFWDVDDFNNEAGTGAAAGQGDVSSFTTTSLASVWDNFDNGTSNRQDFENDSNGVNLRDYQFNGPTSVQTLLNHNCMQEQTDL